MSIYICIHVYVNSDKLYVMLFLAFCSQFTVFKGPKQNNSFRSFKTQKKGKRKSEINLS